MAGIAAIAGLGLQLIGTISQASTARAEGDFQQQLRNQQAQRQRTAAAADAEDFRRRARAIAGTQRARIGGAGVSFEGSPILLAADLAAEAELQAQRVESAGLTEAATLEAEGRFSKLRGRAKSTSALVGGFGKTLLSGAGVADRFFGQSVAGKAVT